MLIVTDTAVQFFIGLFHFVPKAAPAIVLSTPETFVNAQAGEQSKVQPSSLHISSTIACNVHSAKRNRFFFGWGGLSLSHLVLQGPLLLETSSDRRTGASIMTAALFAGISLGSFIPAMRAYTLSHPPPRSPLLHSPQHRARVAPHISNPLHPHVHAEEGTDPKEKAAH